MKLTAIDLFKLKQEGEIWSSDLKTMITSYPESNGRIGVTIFWGKNRQYSIKENINDGINLTLPELNNRIKKMKQELKHQYY